MPLVLLAQEILGVSDPAAAKAARHVGIAWALTGLLRAIPFHARAHRLYMPKDALARHDVAEGRLFDLKPPEGLKAVVGEVADLARGHLREARALRRDVPRAANPALLIASIADTYLGVIAKSATTCSRPRCMMPNPFRQVRLGLRAMTGRYPWMNWCRARACDKQEPRSGLLEPDKTTATRRRITPPLADVPASHLDPPAPAVYRQASGHGP